MTSILQVGTVLWLNYLLLFSSAYELQDTIHTLKEENFHLQHRLENLTQALRDLKHLLTERSKVSGGERDVDYLLAWKEWSQHSISTETHQILEQAFCLTEFPDAANSILITQRLLFVSMIIILLL